MDRHNQRAPSARDLVQEPLLTGRESALLTALLDGAHTTTELAARAGIANVSASVSRLNAKLASAGCRQRIAVTVGAAIVAGSRSRLGTWRLVDADQAGAA